MDIKRTRIGRVQIRKFIKDNEGNLFIKVTSEFDGMIDGSRTYNNSIEPAKKAKEKTEHNEGIEGLYLVCGGDDYFTPYSDETYEGYKWYNCCSSGLLLRKK